MYLNEQTEQAKQGHTYRRRADDSYWGYWGGEGIEHKGKRTHGHGQLRGEARGVEF